MKLHLPTGLRAALIAALTAIASLPSAAELVDATFTTTNSSTTTVSNFWANGFTCVLTGARMATTSDPTGVSITGCDTVTLQSVTSNIRSTQGASGVGLALITSSGEVLSMSTNAATSAGNVTWNFSGVTVATDSSLYFAFYDTANPNIVQGYTMRTGDSGDILCAGGGTLRDYGDTSNVGSCAYLGSNSDKTFNINSSRYAPYLSIVTAGAAAPIEQYNWNGPGSKAAWDTTSKYWLVGDTASTYVGATDSIVNFGNGTVAKEVAVNEAILAGTVNVGDNYTFNVSSAGSLEVAALNVTEGMTTTFAGTGAITLGSFSGPIAIAAGTTVTASAEINVAAGSTLDVSGEGTLNTVTLKAAGGTAQIASNLNVSGGGTGEGGNNSKGLALTGNNAVVNILDGTTKVTGAVYSNGNNIALNVGKGEQDAVLVANRLEFGDRNGGAGTFVIGAHGKVVVKSSNDDTGYKNAALLLSEWNQSISAQIDGELYARDAWLSTGDAATTINVAGTLAVKGIRGLKGTDNKIYFNEGGKLVLGGSGLAAGNGSWTIAFTGAEIGTYANSTELARNFTISDNVTFNTAMYTWTGADDTLELVEGSNAGTITVSGNITGNGTIIKKGAGTLVLTGGANELHNTISVQSGTLQLDGTFSIDNIAGGRTITYSGGTHENNGFKTSKGDITVYQTETGAVVTLGGSSQFTYGGKAVTLENGKYFAGESTDYTTFYVNEDEESASTAKKRSELQNIVLAENTTLNVDEDVSEHITVAAGKATVDIQEGKVVSGTVQNAVMKGTGTYALDGGTQVLGTGTTLDAAWDGIVRLSGTIANITLDGDLQGETVEFNGVTGHFKNVENDQTATYTGDVIFTNAGDTAALTINNGYSRDNATHIFQGDISGEGTWALTNGGITQHYEFQGDLSKWTGQFNINGGSSSKDGNQHNTNLIFSKDAGTVGAAITRTGGYLDLDVHENTTFANTVADVTLVNVSSGKTATFQQNASAGQLIGAGTVKVTGTDTVLTITGAAGTSSTAAVAVDAGATLELAVGNALGSTQTVTNAGNVVIHTTLTQGKIDGGTLTLAADFPVTGGGIEDVGGLTDTGNGFSQGGTLHIVENRDQQLADITSIIHGDKTYALTDVSTDGNITMAGADWSIYQLKVENDAQPTIQAIMDYADEKGSGTGVLKQIVVTGEGLSLVDDSEDFKTSMLGGDKLESLSLALVDGAILTMDADLAGGLMMTGQTATDEATIVLEKDAEIKDSLFIYNIAEGAATLTVEGEHTLTTPMFGTMGGNLVLQKGAKFATPLFGIEQGESVTVKDTAELSLANGGISIKSVDGTKDASLTNVDGDAYDLNNAGHTLKDARITISYSDAAHDFGHTISGAVALVNDGTSSVRDINAANTAYDELAAQKGDIYLANKDSVSVRNLTLGAGRTVAAATATQPVAITVNGTASFGSGATVGAALTMAGGSTLDGSASLANHDLVLGAAATDKLNIGDNLWSALDDMSPEGTMNLFTGVSALTLGGSTYSAPVDLTSIFSHGSDIKSGKYSLSYDGSNVIVTRAADNDRYWKGGSGDWNTTSTVWTDQESGGTDVTFESGYNAHFAAASSGIVTLRENITAANVYVTGADYTFAAGGYTLTVTDLFEVDGHTATLQGLGLNGADLKLTAKNGGELVLNGTSSVKDVEIGSGSAIMADGSTLAVAGSLVNNGSLSADTLILSQGTAQGGNVDVGTLNLTSGQSYTFKVLTAPTISGTGADLTISDNGSLAATNTATLKNLTTGEGAQLDGNITVTGNTNAGVGTMIWTGLTTGTLTGGPVMVDDSNLTLTSNGSLGLVQFSGTSSLTASGTATVTLDAVLVNSDDSDELTLTGKFDASNLGASKSDSKYVEGVTEGNGFEQARMTITIVNGGTTSASGATILFRGRTLTEKVDANGKVTFDGDTDYTKFYVNTGSEKVSTALENASQKLGTFELADNTTLEVNKNISMSMVNVAADKSATMQIDSGSTVTTDGTAKALTLKGAGTLAVDTGKTATGVTLDNTWTGTVSFTEAQLTSLVGAWKSGSTVSLTGITGSLGSNLIEGKVVLNKGTGDWGFGQTATDGVQYTNLENTLTGDGNLGVKSGTVDSTFNLNGDINGWNGNFIVATDADTTLNLGGSGAKIVNGTVSGTNLEVNVNADTTFSGALNVEKLTVDTSKAATLKADSTVNEVDAYNGSLKVDDGKTLTVTANALPKGLKLGVDSTINLGDDAYMGGEDYAYYGGTVTNGTDREQAMGFNNADITVTGTTLGVNGGSGFTVDNKLVDATLAVENGLPSTVILNNVQDSLEVAGDLEIGPGGLLKVANGSSKQTLNISGGTKLTLADSTTLDADLTLNSGATLRLDYNMGSPVATSLESGALTLASGLTLSGDLYTQIEGMEDTGSFVNLFKGVGALTLGESAYSEPVKAQLYFSNMADLDEKGDYWLEYNAETDIVSIRFEATSAHTLTWNGTATEHRWVQDNDTVTDWLEGNPAASAYFQEGDNAKFTADAAEKTVTIEQDITARNITIDSPELYTFENSDDYSITAQKFEMTGHDGLAKTGEGKLTLDIIGDVSLTESALMVQEGSLEIGTAAKSGKLDLQASALEIAEDAELTVASIEGDGTSSIELAGTMTVSEGTVSNLTATEGSLLKIADLGQTTAGTLSVKTDTTLYGLENGGTLDLGNKTLNLMEQTEQGGNVTAGKLNLAENGNEFKELGTNRVTYAYGSEGSGQLDADAPNLVVDSIAPTMVIPSIALDVTETMGDGGSLGAINRLGDEVTYTLIHANNGLGTVGFTLVGEALLIQNGLLHAESGLWSDGNNLNLTVGGLDLTWYTSNDETEWGYKVVDETGALTDGANTLNGVQHVLVDEDRTVDVTGVGSEPGLRVRNLAGLDGSTITFSGEEGDTVNLITTEETASNVNLAAENITVKVGLDELDGMDPEDYKDLRVGDVDLTGATLAVHSYEDLDAAFTVNTLSGDDESTLKGRVIVEGQGGEYFGGYENAYVILHENAEQTLAAGEGLTVAGLGAAKLAYVGPETHMDGIEGINMTVTLNDPKQDNSGTTLVLDKPSWLVDGTIISGMSAIKSGATLDTAEAPNLIQAAGLNLDGTTIILNQDAADNAAMAMAVNALGKTKGLYLAHLGAEDSNTDRVLLNGYLYNKYYQNARLEGGKLLVDRRDAFFTEDVVRPTTVNGRAGAGMLDDALLEINPQATNPQGDLAAVMTALETNAVANPDRVAAAVAGASAAALGHAFNNDVQRQLRAIRNRTTTMGLAECVKHEGLPYVNAWVNAEGDYRKLDADGTLAGYTLSSWGGTIGCDVDLTGRLTVGAAFTVLHGEFTSHSADMCEGDLDRDYVSLFARYGYRAWTHTFVATLGFAKSKVDRTVNYGTGSYTTRGDSDGNAFGFLYEVGYTKALNEDASTCLQPIFNVNYRHSSLGGYTEKGGSDAALSVGSADMDAVTFGLGARLQSIVGTSVYNRATLFEGRVLAKLDAGDRDCTTNSSLIGVSAKRSVKSAEVGAFGVEVGAGLTIPVGETGGSIFMDVTGDFRSGYTEFNGTVGYRFSF